MYPNTIEIGHIKREVKNVMGVSCKSLGMISNDSSDDVATSNYNLICVAMNMGYRLLVDNKYYILPSVGGTDITSGKIDIEGNSSLAELIINPAKTGSYIMFTSAVNFSINMTKLKFTSNVAGGLTQIVRYTTAIYVTSINVKECVFSNRVRFITNGIVAQTDPSTYGIDYINFSFNQCFNVAGDTYGLFVLTDTPITYAILEHNRVLNFANSFYNNGITNGHTYANELALASKLLIARHNKVMCEDTWITPTVGCGVTLGTYQTFVLFEGVEVVYTNNQAEGIHTFSDESVVYDAYLSAHRVIYKNNFWKNNICFDSTPGYNSLFKAKSYTKASYIDTYRECVGNTFIATKAYADTWTRPYSEILTEIMDIQSEIDKVVYKNNIVDVYRLGISYSKPVYEYIFNNNVITADATVDATNCLAPYYNLTSPTLARGITAKDNIINIINRDLAVGKDCIVMSKSDSFAVNRQDKIIVENNNINWNGLGSIIKGSTSITPSIIERLEMRKNSINSTVVGTVSGKYLYFSIYAVVRELIFKDNDIEIPTTSHSMQSFMRGGMQKIEAKYNIKSFHRSAGASISPCFGLVSGSASNQELLTVEALFTKVSIKCHHSEGVDDFYFEYKHYPTGGVNTVLFTSSTDSAITQGITMDNSNTNTLVKLIGTASKFTVTFINTATNCSFDLATTLPTDEYVNLEVTISQCVKT